MIGLIIFSILTIVLVGLSVYYLVKAKTSFYTVGFFLSTIGAIGYVFKVLHLTGAGLLAGLNIFTYLFSTLIFMKIAIERNDGPGRNVFFYYLLSTLILLFIIASLVQYSSLRPISAILLLVTLLHMKFRKIYLTKEDGQLINLLTVFMILFLTDRYAY